MEIHFVCLGNTYRSRLAEAYFNSLAIRGVHAVSSGIQGGEQPMATRWFAEKILEERGLSAFTRKAARQTTKENIRHGDLVVFFKRETLAFCKQWLDARRQQWTVWNISDVDVNWPAVRLMRVSEQTFRSIKRHVDQLKKTYALS